jgi:outer membrane protein assembly factor BamB
MVQARFVLLSVLLPATALANGWPQFGMSATHDHSSTEISGPTFTASWSLAMNGASPLISSPIVSSDFVVAAAKSGQVVAVTAREGRVIWQQTLAGGVGASPAQAAGRIFLPSLGGQLYAIQLDNGNVQWQRALGGTNYSSPTLITDPATGAVDSLVLAAGFPAKSLSRVRVSDGSSIWESKPGDIANLVYSSPALAGQQLIVGMNYGRLQSFDLATGTAGWHYDAAGQVYLSSPLVHGDRAYFFPGDPLARLFAVDTATGAAVAGFPLSVADPAGVPAGQLLAHKVSVSSPVSIGDRIVVQVRQEYQMATNQPTGNWILREYVVAIDPVAAAVIWQKLLGGLETTNPNLIPELALCPTPAAYGARDGRSFLAVGASLDAHVRVLDAADGSEQWSAQLSGATRSSPVLSNGRLFVATDAGVLHAFQSDFNAAPLPPQKLLAQSVSTPDGVRALLGWLGATDSTIGPLTYEARVDGDGEILQSYLASATTKPDETSWQVSQALDVGLKYAFAVRSRDQYGAWSEWSAPQDFTIEDVPVAMTPPPVSPPMASDQPGSMPAPMPLPMDMPSTPPSADMPSAVTSAPPAAASMRSVDLSNGEGGCSLAPGRGQGPFGLLLGALPLAAMLRRRARSVIARGGSVRG